LNLLIPQLFEDFAERLLRRRGVFFAVFVIGVLVVAAGASRLHVDFSARAFFGGDAKAEAAFDAFASTFGSDERVVAVVVDSVDPDGGKSKPPLLLEQAPLDDVAQLARALRSVEGVAEVTDLASTTLPTTTPDGALVLTSVQDQLRGVAGLQRQALLAQLLSHTTLVPTLLSKDGRTTALFVELDVPADDIGAMRPVVQALEAKIAGTSTPRLQVQLGGTPVVRSGLVDAILHDQLVFVPLSFLLMTLLLWLLFRRFHGVALPLLNALLPSALVMGVMGYLNEPIGVVNQVYFTLLPVIAVSGAIHLLSRFYEEAERTGTQKDTLLPTERGAAVRLTLRAVGGACLFSALTTVVGLSSLHLSPMHVLQRFGVYSAVGVAFAFVTLVVVNPLVLATTRGRALSPQQLRVEGRIDAFLGACADVALGRPRLFVVIGLVVLASGAAALSSIRVDNQLVGMLAKEHGAVATGKRVDAKLGGQLSLNLHFKAGPDAPASRLLAPDVLQTMHALDATLLDDDAVRAVHGPHDVVQQVQSLLTPNDTALPTSAEQTAQLLFLVDGHPALKKAYADDRRQAHVMVRLQDRGSRHFVDLADRVAATYAQHQADAPSLQDVELVVTGASVVAYRGLNHLTQDMVQSVLLALCIIVLLMGLIFRSARVALLIVLPNALPLAVGAVLMALLGWTLQPGTAVIFTVALGIAVDDTIHLLVRVGEGQQAGRPLPDAIQSAIIKSGRPVIITTIILVCGFGVNGFSQFPTNAMAGVLGASVVFAALLADLFVLPAVLVLFGPRPSSTTDAS